MLLTKLSRKGGQFLHKEKNKFRDKIHSCIQVVQLYNLNITLSFVIRGESQKFWEIFSDKKTKREKGGKRGTV